MEFPRTAGAFVGGHWWNHSGGHPNGSCRSIHLAQWGPSVGTTWSMFDRPKRTNIYVKHIRFIFPRLLRYPSLSPSLEEKHGSKYCSICLSFFESGFRHVDIVMIHVPSPVSLHCLWIRKCMHIPIPLFFLFFSVSCEHSRDVIEIIFYTNPGNAWAHKAANVQVRSLPTSWA